MVCKEEVFTWFQNLKGSKRIETIYRFLHMCYPLELRFYGTCLEKLGSKDFYVFKDDELKANDSSEVHKIKNIHNPKTRSKLIVFLSLLHSSNLQCAMELFKVISEEVTLDNLISLGIFSDTNLVDQYLLLLSLAHHHPAFTFEQQMFFAELTSSLESYICDTMYSAEKEQSISDPVNNMVCNLPPSCGNSSKQHLLSSKCYSQITSLKVKPSQKKLHVKIKVAWENIITEAFKTPHDLVVFHQQLVLSYPSEAKSLNQEKFIPPLPYALSVWKKQNGLNENIVSEATNFIQSLIVHLPNHILQSDYVRNFFMPSKPRRTRSKPSPAAEIETKLDTQSKTSRLPSLTIYNSQMSDSSPRFCHENTQRKGKSKKKRQNRISHPSPFTSPMESPISSPVASNTNSRAASPWNTAPVERSNGQETSQQSGQNFKIEELQAMPIEELKSLGLLDNKVKLQKPDVKSLPNGFIKSYIPKNGLIPKFTPNLSNHTSPIGSEYSSPPQSPPLAIGSQNISGNGEIVQKRPFSETNNKPDDPDTRVPEPGFKRIEEEPVSMKANSLNRPISIIPFTVPYSTIISSLPPPQNMKPMYLPIPCRSNSIPQHISPVIFDNNGQQYRVPSVLPSALTFLPPPRSHSGTPDRILPSPPFPVVATSGCTTAPIGTCSVTTQRSSTVTVVTNSRYPIKNPSYADKPLPQTCGDVSYTSYPSGFLLNTSTAASCSCYTTTSTRPSPSPSPITQPTTVPYLGLPYVFHSMPFLQQANGYIQPTAAPPGTQGFTYAISPELIYQPGQSFIAQNTPPVVVPNVGPVKSCYNCGKVGHIGLECKEATIEDICQAGRFQLNYRPPPKIPDS